MPTKAEAPKRPDPKSPDYQQKNSLIAQLGFPGDDRTTSSSLYSLGSALAVNPMLSRKQEQNLLFALIDAGLLTYQKEFEERLNKVEEEEGIEKRQEEQESSLDPAFWEIENDDRLQTRAVVVSAALTNDQDIASRVTLIVSLFNQAHISTSKNFYYDELPDKRYQISVDNGLKKEEEVFVDKDRYVKELVQLGLATTPQEEEVVEDLDIDGFRALRGQTDLYDRLIALSFVRNFHGRNTEQIFRELQVVLYFGYTMGVVDQVSAFRREYEIES